MVPAEWHLVDRVVGSHCAYEIVAAGQQGPESRGRRFQDLTWPRIGENAMRAYPTSDETRGEIAEAPTHHHRA